MKTNIHLKIKATIYRPMMAFFRAFMVTAQIKSVTIIGNGRVTSIVELFTRNRDHRIFDVTLSPKIPREKTMWAAGDAPGLPKLKDYYDELCDRQAFSKDIKILGPKNMYRVTVTYK